MAVYDDQKHRGGVKHTPDDDELAQMTGIGKDEEGAMDREAYNEAARDILDREREAAKGDVGDSIKAGGAATAGTGAAAAAGSKDGKASAASDEGSSKEEDVKGSLFRKEAEGGLFRQEEEKSKRRGGNFKIAGIPIASKRRAMIIVGSLITTIATTVAAIFTSLLPFQLPSITQFLENHKYAIFDNAADKTMERMFTQYLAAVLLPGMREKGCASTKIDLNCARDMKGEGPVRLLYRKMAGYDKGVQSIEYKLAQRGIEIASNGRTGKIYMKIPNSDAEIDLSRLERGEVTNMFTEMREVSKADVKATIWRVLEEEGDFKKLRYRMKVGNLLKKHGIIRCMVACEFRKKMNGTNREKKLAAIAFLNQRILEPRSQLLGVYVSCLLNSCSDELRSDGTLNDEATNGEPMDEIRRSTRSTLAAASAKFGAEKLQDIVKRVENLDRDGLTLHMTKLAIEKLGGSVDPNNPDPNRRINPDIVSRLAGGPAAVVLAIVKLALIADSIHQLKTMNYALNAAAGVQMFEMLRTVSHETKSHNMDAAMLGSMTNLARHGPFNTGPGMEDSPIYDETFASARTTPTAAFLKTILPQKAYAQATNPSTVQSYRCDNNKTSLYQEQVGPGSANNLVCPELRLGYSNFATKISDFIRGIPGVSAIIGFLRLIEAGIAFLGGIVAGLLDYVPFLNDLLRSISSWISEFLMKLLFQILKDPLGDRPSGARIMEMAIMGAEVGAADSAHRLLGGQVLSPADQTAIVQEQQAKERAAFAIMPLRERLFSTESTYSLTSQLALNMPSNLHSAARQSFASLLGNPFGKLASSFGSLFALQPAYAQSFSARPSAFDVVPHGYPVNDPFFSADPLVFWDEQCKEGKIDVAYNTARDQADNQDDTEMEALVREYGFIIDDRTNQVINPKANPCFMLSTLGKYDEPPKPPANAGGGGGGVTGPFNGPSLAGKQVLFVGDYEPGNFSQWGTCQSVYQNTGCAGYNGSHYSATIVSGGEQRQGQYAARYEVRDGDVPNFGGGERSEVRAPGPADVREGDERWYQFSLKFDQNFPNPRGGWFIVMQWHSGGGSPPLALEVSRDGQLKLQNNRGESPPKTIGPIQRGQWVDYTLHVKFSSNASVGFVEAWENNVQKVPRSPHKTMASGSNYLKMGIYRDGGDPQTHIVYQDGLIVTGP